MRAPIRTLFLCLAASAAVALQAAPPTWNIEPLGSLAGKGSFANGLNNRGDIVGYSSLGIPTGFGPDYYHGFLWQDGTMVDAGAPGGRTNVYSYLTDINDHGLAVGASSGYIHTWKEGTWTSLGFTGEPAGINKSGTIAGSRTIGGGYIAFIYQDGLARDLPTLGGSSSVAYGLNDRGVVVGSASTAQGPMRPFAYEGGVTRDLGTLGGIGGRATAINDRGVIVGQAETASGAATAFIHDGTSMRPLVPGVMGLYPVAINNRGDVVGTRDYNTSSFLLQDGQLIKLEDLPAVRAAGWTRLDPSDINDRGWITGWGTRQGRTEAFVLKPR